MKKNLICLLFTISLLLIGCKTRNSDIIINDNGEDLFNNPFEINESIIVDFKDYVKDDNVSSIYVNEEGELFSFDVSRYVDYKYENKLFVFSKEEARHIIINELGFFGKYVTYMDEECANKLDLKLIYKKPDIYNIMIEDYYYVPICGLVFEYVGLFEGKEQILIKDFVFVESKTISSKSEEISKVLDLMNKKEKVEINYSKNHQFEEGYTYFFLNGRYSSNNYIYGEKILPFKDGVMVYDELDEIDKRSVCLGKNYDLPGEIENGPNILKRLEEVKRSLYKSHSEGTTLEELLRELKETLLINRWAYYIDNRIYEG